MYSCGLYGYLESLGRRRFSVYAFLYFLGYLYGWHVGATCLLPWSWKLHLPVRALLRPRGTGGIGVGAGPGSVLW